MYFLYTIIASLVAFFVLKWMKKRRYCTDLKRLDGKTVLITGKSAVSPFSIHIYCLLWQRSAFENHFCLILMCQNDLS